jgi:hypothetical protein
MSCPSAGDGVALKFTIFVPGNLALSASQLAVTLWWPSSNKNQVEEIFGKVFEPAVCGPLQRMDVGDNDIGCFEVGSIRGGSSDFDRFGVRLARQHAALDVEHVSEGRIKIVVELFGDGHAGRDDKRARSLKSKRS